MFVKHIQNYRWENVYEKPYKIQDNSFLNVKRFEIIKGKEIELRYFEIEKGGYSSLEKHEHEHIVIFLKGRGIVLIGDEIYNFEPFDIIHIPSWKNHRFIAKDEDVGFFCIVVSQRDKPQKLTEKELEELINKNPKLRDIIKI
ncbi:MAG: cupin domain-containing protein [candidate division WOR-3 bacterium]